MARAGGTRREGRDTRARLLVALTAHPGIGLSELAREVGIARATCHYQLGVLERMGYIERPRRYTRRAANRVLLPFVDGSALRAGPDS